MIETSADLAALQAVEPTLPYVRWAVYLGALSAVSLPLGSVLGLVTRPSRRISGAMAAFGAGALLAALAVELVAPTVEAARSGGSDEKHALALLIGGAVGGGLLFLALDAILAQRGGFLRNVSSTISWIGRRQNAERRALLGQLCKFDLFRCIPPEHVAQVVDSAKTEQLEDGAVLFEAGDRADSVYVVRDGAVALSGSGEEVHRAGVGELVGETAVLVGEARLFRATARGSSRLIRIPGEAFQGLRSAAPEFDQIIRRTAGDRLSDWSQQRTADLNQERDWARAAIQAMGEDSRVPDRAEVAAVAEATSDSAPLAVWLGILLDGIPESLVIGAGLATAVQAQYALGVSPSFVDLVPLTLIAGLFLSNLPEALSSSVNMAASGFSRTRILLMWLSLTLLTAVGAGFGAAIAEDLHHSTLVAIEGFAAGAMLTMIASSAVPEAVHLSGRSMTGLYTLLGFLAAVSFELISKGA